MPGQEAPPAKLMVGTLLDAARAEAGLADFGEPDVLVPLSILIKSLNEEAQLTAAGIEGQYATLRRTLVNRLRIQDALKKHPEIASERINRPIVIVGLPRSGTTKLQRMLSSDPGLQKLPLWKCVNPAPFPDAKPGLADPRIAYAEEMVAQLRALYPKFHAAHPMQAQEPEEDIYLMLPTLISSILMHSAHTPSYKAWMVAQDCAGWYRYLRLLLQFIQWQDGSPQTPWVLKAPWHFRWLRELLRVFPDATIVQCYRDPRQTIPSMAALFEETRKMSSDLDQPLEVGRLVMDYWGNTVRSFLQQRDELGMEDRFVDVQYTDILKSPLKVIRRIYAAAGLPLSDHAQNAMQSWETANPQNKHGQHVYSLDRFGLSPDDIEARFSDYIERYRGEG